jgi:hypothetical protein
MLTISISEALQGPAAAGWSEWGATDAEALEAWQLQQMSAAEWHLETESAEVVDENAPFANMQTDASLWSQWAADAEVEAWPRESQSSFGAAEVQEMAAAIKNLPALTAADMAGKPGPGNEAAWASPLRVPLPEPLAVQPLSKQLDLGLELEMLGLPAENGLADKTTRREPQKIDSLAGLRTQSGPSALLADVRPTLAAPADPAPSQKPAALELAAITDHAPPGIVISRGEVVGRPCTHVDWKIDDFSGKLQASMGRPVVSPAFTACGLSNLRLMVFPDARDAVKSARSHERKGLYATMVKKGPLYGSLKLKADGLECATVITFSLLVGGVRAGPTTYDFSEQAVQGLDDFNVDWLQQVEKGSGALHVGIEIVEVRRK